MKRKLLIIALILVMFFSFIQTSSATSVFLTIQQCTIIAYNRKKTAMFSGKPLIDVYNLLTVLIDILRYNSYIFDMN